MSHADLTKPPLAPKPKILSHLASIAASKFPPSLSRSGSLHNSNSMSRGPKPPIAPKPKISVDSDAVILQRASIYANNTFNKCTNGKLICTEGELYEGNRCSIECPESQVDGEYIVIPEAELIDKDYNDFEQEQDLENETLHLPDDEEEDNCIGNNEICDIEINVSKNNDAEPVEEDSIESTKFRAFGNPEAPGNKKEDECEKVDCETDPTETKMNCADEAEQTLGELDLVKENNEYNMDNKILNGDEILKDNLYEEIILSHLEEPTPRSEDPMQNCVDSEEPPQCLEEEQTNAGPEMGTAPNDGNESALNIEVELVEDVCASPDILADESETVDTGLELCGSKPDAEEDLIQKNESNEADSEKEEEIGSDADYETSKDQEEIIDGDYQITDMKSKEETQETECDNSVISEEQNVEVLETEIIDDSCQIIPFERECSEDAPDSPEEYLGENVPLQGTEMSNDNQTFILPETNVLASESEVAEDAKANVLSGNCIDSELALEDSQSDNPILGVDQSNSEDMAPNIPTEAPVEGECCPVGESEKCNHKTERKQDSAFMIDEMSVVPVMVVLPDREDSDLVYDSLDDPYVLGDKLPIANETFCVGQKAEAPDGHDSSSDFREGVAPDTESHLLPVDRKSIVTRTRSHSGKVPGYVPETVPEETGPDIELQPSSTTSIVADDVSLNFSRLEGKAMELNRALPAKPRRFVSYPRSYSVEGRDNTVSVYREMDTSILEYNRINRTEDLALPCVISSSGSFSQRNHLPSSGVSTPSSVVDIPPPFDLACITKKPITKSSPSLLIESESPDKYCKKKKSSFKKFLTLKFKKKTENKVHVDVHVSSSRSSSESSYHGPSRVLELDRRSLSSSPQLISRTGKLLASESPTVLFYKDGKRRGTAKTFSRSVSRVESFEDRSRPPFIPLPLTKPRSISFPNADTSDYENIPAMSSDYENIQIPPRRPTRAGTFTEFFEDPSRALSAANENDGYVDMSSFTAFENNKQQHTNQETESAYTEPYKVCPISVVPVEDVTSDEEQKSSGDGDSNQGDSSLTHKKEGQSRAHLIAQELVSSEKVYVEMLRLLHTNFYEPILKVLGDEDNHEEGRLKEGLSEIPEIYELHQDILGELEEKVLNWEEHQKVADVFLSRESRFNHHTTYIVQFDRNLALLDEARLKSPQLDIVIREFEQFHGGSPLKVKHQLLKVVQRIFQYHVLLTDYLNNLCPDSAEYEDTQAALLIVSEVADRANDCMQQGENLQKLVHIEHSVKGQSNLLQPGRVFLKEGTLMKVSGKNRHPRHLFLMNDVLLYTYPQKDGKYRLKNTLAVSGMRVSRPVTEKVQNVLKIEYAENCLILSASSCSERDEWYSCISRSIPDDYRTHSAAAFHNSVELRERLGIPLGERPPTLVPVSHVMMCMNCGCDFKLTLRRHHCHACGKIVCRNCSRNKYPLKYLKDRLAKVCDGCYSDLKRRERPMSMSFPTSSSRFSGSAFSSVFHNIHYSSFKRQKKIPSALLEVGPRIPTKTEEP